MSTSFSALLPDRSSGKSSLGQTSVMWATPGLCLFKSSAGHVPSAAMITETFAAISRDGDSVLKLDKAALGMMELCLDGDDHSGLERLFAIMSGVLREGSAHEPRSLMTDDAHAMC
ncbi:hypothetical protein HGG75_27940 [Ochrobactrum pseudogrignonense]|nr:hypothetical protein [Brucella pseudogrignonensis]